MAGPSVHEDVQDLFLSHLSIFTDRPDDSGVFIRQMRGRHEDFLMKTYNLFYGNNMVYDLTRQWVIQDGPFRYDYSWLSRRHPPEALEAHAKRLFARVFGASPDEFSILAAPAELVER